jgi:hypothetical protein
MKLLLFISGILLAVAAAAAPNSWFREKYLSQTYDEYYHYSISRYRFGNNDHDDVCPEIHKSATFFAITGRQMNRKNGVLLPICPSVSFYANAKKYNTKHAIYQEYTHPEVQYARFIMSDIIEPLGKFIEYIFELCMILCSILFASFISLVVIILTFAQY